MTIIHRIIAILECNLRVKEEFEKSGFFWLSTNPNRKLSGKLTISEGGYIELQVVGIFDESQEGLSKLLNGKYVLTRIIGEIQDHGYVTLDGCYYKNTNLNLGGISVCTIYVTMALLGVGYDADEELLFNSFQFSIEGIDEWVGLIGIKTEFIPDTRESRIAYAPPDKISYSLKNGMGLSVIFKSTITGLGKTKDASISQKIYLKLESNKKLKLHRFIAIAFKITTFLCFAIGDNVCIEKVSVTDESIRRDINEEKSIPTSIILFYQSLPYTKTLPKIDVYRMLFKYDDIKENANTIINNWIDAYDFIDPSLNLFFSTKSGGHKFLESKFLALAQCLETYHRRTSNEKIMDDDSFLQIKNFLIDQCPEKNKKWLSDKLKYANEINLSRRIKKIIEPFKETLGTRKNRKRIIRDIVITRNYLTHYDQSIEDKSVKGKKLLSLCRIMETIFQFHLLQVLGFNESELESIYNNSYVLKQNLKSNYNN